MRELNAVRMTMLPVGSIEINANGGDLRRNTFVIFAVETAVQGSECEQYRKANGVIAVN